MLHAHEHVHFNSDDFQALDFSCGFAAVILRNWKTHKCNLIVSFCSRHILCTCIKITQQIQRDFCSPQWKEEMKLFIQSTENWSAEVVNCSWNKWRTHLISPTHFLFCFCVRFSLLFSLLSLPKCSCHNFPNETTPIESKPSQINLFFWNAWQIEFCGFV